MSSRYPSPNAFHCKLDPPPNPPDLVYPKDGIVPALTKGYQNTRDVVGEAYYFAIHYDKTQSGSYVDDSCSSIFDSQIRLTMECVTLDQ